MTNAHQIPFNQRLFTVRPPDPHDHPNTSNSTYRFTKRIKVSVDLIRQAGLCSGDWIMLKPALKLNQIDQLTTAPNLETNNSKSSNHFSIGILWPQNNPKQDSVTLSLDHLMSASIRTGDFVNLIPLPPILSLHHSGPGRGIRLPEAREIHLKEIDPNSLSEQINLSDFIPSLVPSPTSLQQPQIKLTKQTNRLWEGFVREVLVDRKYLAIKHFISIPFASGLRLYCVENIQPLTSISSSSPCATSTPFQSPLELFVVTRKTQLKITALFSSSSVSGNSFTNTATSSAVKLDSSWLHPKTAQEAGYDAVGGLESQIEQIRELVELPLTRPELYSHFGLTPPRGILLHGPPGTGKTLLASIIAKSTQSTLLSLSTATVSSAYHGEAEQRIYDLFEEAKVKSPSIIVIDEIDGLFPNRDVGGEVDRRVVGAMLTCMDGMDEKTTQTENGQSMSQPRVIVVATTNRPHTLDPALRRPGRFDRELEIGIPDGLARLKIFKVLLRRAPNNLTEEEVKEIANKTHGFVGADLNSLIREAGLRAIKRSLELLPTISTEEMRLEMIDLEGGLMNVRPSGMREVYIETPKVRWKDIGGQEEVKQRLIESVEWPLKYPSSFKRLGIKPTKGILLYGPPGCSKTLIAKALASESQFNFISIKGSEVFNKYLGESEKSIRDLFRKARMASPSIIFLDEIDSIATSRSSGLEGNGSKSFNNGGSNSSVNDRVLTSLLIEIDGIEELNGVLILAATNRPDVIDPALMRPGRLDRILYVGPPDLKSRIEIFKINFKKMSISEVVRIDKLAELTDGCTGAEIVSICQDAAMNAMRRDFNVESVEEEDFLVAITNLRRRTTIEMIKSYEDWRDKVGIKSA